MDRPQPGLMNNEPPPPDAHDLWRHFSETYFSLRLGLAMLAFAFPAIHYFWVRFVHDLPLQPSLSAYFYAAPTTGVLTHPHPLLALGNISHQGSTKAQVERFKMAPQQRRERKIKL